MSWGCSVPQPDGQCTCLATAEPAGLSVFSHFAWTYGPLQCSLYFAASFEARGGYVTQF